MSKTMAEQFEELRIAFKKFGDALLEAADATLKLRPALDKLTKFLEKEDK